MASTALGATVRIVISFEIATADALSNARLMLGVGAGYQPYEFERFGVDIKAALSS
jgi:alkanesulfonate monooxygenase SsuD/methylene tetrahydromethanopterin reductase-like flavin-dependent oxidoreductase (luciferase family)